MKVLGLIALFFFLGGVSFAQDCDQFKTGNFVVRSPSGDVFIKRTATKQIERADGVVSKNKVVWMSDCMYKLVSTKYKDNDDNDGDEDVICKIIETGDGYYIVRAHIAGTHNYMNVRLEVVD